MDTRPESLEGVLKELRINLILFVGLFPLSGECDIHKSSGVWYGKSLYL